MRRNWKIFLMSLLVASILAAFACKASAMAGCVPEKRFCGAAMPRLLQALHEGRQYLSIQQDVFREKGPAKETSPEKSRMVWDEGRTPAFDERVIYLSKKSVTERFLREKSVESLVVQQGFFAGMSVSIRALSEFETDPPVVLLLMTQIAVRK